MRKEFFEQPVYPYVFFGRRVSEWQNMLFLMLEIMPRAQ
jgi:hypothetical protein